MKMLDQESSMRFVEKDSKAPTWKGLREVKPECNWSLGVLQGSA
jgi:hypothetical protein